MTWVRLDDSFADHPKVRALSPSAFRAHVVVLCYCARHLTDGAVAGPILASLGVRGKDTAELVRARLWHETDGGIVVHDYLEYNPSRSDVEDQRRAAAERLGRHRSKTKRNADATHLQRVANGAHNALETLPPSRPVPIPSPDPDIAPFGSSSSCLDAPDGSGERPREPEGPEKSRESAKPDPFAAQVREVFEFWKANTGHPKALLDRKRDARIRARLRDKFTVDELKLAIKNRIHDPHLMGESKGGDGRLYDGIETLLRDVAQVERLRDLRPETKSANTRHDQRQWVQEQRAPQPPPLPPGERLELARGALAVLTANVGKAIP